MAIHKVKKISEFYGIPFNDLTMQWYSTEMLSGPEIANKISNESGIQISVRHIQRYLKQLGITRTYSEAFNLAIKKGRKSYKHLSKPIKSSEFRKGINLKVRYEILKRDNFRCVLCGQTARNTLLVIDHIAAIVKGGSNDPNNLRVLCRECNHGKMISEHEK